MTKIPHTLQFITEIDETTQDPTALRLLALDKAEQIALLEGMLQELLVPTLKPILDELNKNNSFATLKVVA
jgi:hypothetical protein